MGFESDARDFPRNADSRASDILTIHVELASDSLALRRTPFSPPVLVIGRNIPLDRVLGWIVSLAPRGIIEFVPKSDPQLQKMLTWREDVFPDYCQESFLSQLRNHAYITQQRTLPSNGRLLVAFERCAITA